jgi:very-short-patch-repair endonuclease
MAGDNMDDMDRMAARLRSGLQSTWEGCIYGTIEHMEEVCESPIEVMLGAAMLLGCNLYDGVSKVCKPFVSLHRGEDLRFDQSLILMVPQYKWNNYRIDFAMFGRAADQVVFVECDGHDFHERTKDQAARDRSKDRAIQEAGIPILRFTGSEIYRNPEQCVTQIINVVGNVAVEKSNRIEK